MQKSKLGKTNLEVSRLSLGGLFVSSYGAAFEQAREAVHLAVQSGINYIDTAPGYADSEECLGKALEGVDAPLIFSTKLGGRPQPFFPQDKDVLRQSFEESLRLLKRETIDILMIHEPDRPGQYDWWTDWTAATGPVVEFLEEEKQRGRIQYTGLAGTTVYPMTRLIEAGNFDVVLTAFNYSLLWREAEFSVLPAAKAKGMGIVIGSPLQQGALARKWSEVETGVHWLSPQRQKQFQELYALVDETELSLPELALRFVLSNPDISSVLTGARSPQEVEMNVAAAKRGPLPEDVLARLKEIADQVPCRPADEPVFPPFGREYKGPGQL